MLGTIHKPIVIFLLSTCLSSIGSTFEEQIQRKLADAPEALAHEGLDGWMFPTEELRFSIAGPFWGEAAISSVPGPNITDPMPAIVDFRDQLAKKDVELILVPIPPKLWMVPDKFHDGDASGLSEATSKFYQLLRDQGVTVLDLQSQFAGKEEMYCRTDSHYSGQGLQVAAGEISRLIRERVQSPCFDSAEFTKEELSVDIQGDLGDAKETLVLQKVEGFSPDRKSPVLLLGDSHCLVFSVGGDLHAEGSGLPEHLSAALGCNVDVLGVRGSGATTSRFSLFQRARRDSSYWSFKKVVVWCFAARDFTETPTGWRKVPIGK